MNTSTLVPFHGNSLYLVEFNGEPYTPMKPIVEGMGLDWKTQLRKLTQRFKSTMVEMTIVAADGKNRQMVCLALRKLPGWLYSISAGKVRPEIHDTVLQYQAECDDALWSYWTKGTALNPRYRDPITRKVLPNGLTKDQQEAVKALHRQLTMTVPHEKQAGMAIKLWSCVKAKFGVSYKEVPPEQFPEVLSLMSRVALEGEILPAETNPGIALPGYGRYLVVADETGVRVQDIKNCDVVSRDTHGKVRRDLRITSRALVDLAERMRALEGDASLRMLETPIHIGISL